MNEYAPLINYWFDVTAIVLMVVLFVVLIGSAVLTLIRERLERDLEERDYFEYLEEWVDKEMNKEFLDNETTGDKHD